MKLSDVAMLFNRALTGTLSVNKWLLTFAVLAITGLIVIFFRGLALHGGGWMGLSLTFLPILITGSILLGLGVLLIRIYHDEMKRRDISYKEVLSKSWNLMLNASYFALPVILVYLVLWLLLGVFVLLAQIPVAGYFFSAILCFIPFVLYVGILVLCVINVLMLFFLAPIFALKGMDQMVITGLLMKRVMGDAFSNVLQLLVALFPALLIGVLLSIAAALTGSLCVAEDQMMQNVLVSFFVMLPFTALLAPAIIFFFNFAAEAHIFMQKK